MEFFEVTRQIRDQIQQLDSQIQNPSLEEISTQSGPFNPNSNSMSSCVS